MTMTPAQRSKAYRSRIAMNVRVVPVEADPEIVEILIEAGFLTERNEASREAIGGGIVALIKALARAARRPHEGSPRP